MCPSRSYPGLWEMVINQLEALEISCATLDSCPSELSGQEIYQTLLRNFNRHYSTSRAPFGIHLQAAWFENTEYLAAFQVNRNYCKFAHKGQSYNIIYYTNNETFDIIRASKVSGESSYRFSDLPPILYTKTNVNKIETFHICR